MKNLLICSIITLLSTPSISEANDTLASCGQFQGEQRTIYTVRPGGIFTLWISQRDKLNVKIDKRGEAVLTANFPLATFVSHHERQSEDYTVKPVYVQFGSSSFIETPRAIIVNDPNAPLLPEIIKEPRAFVKVQSDEIVDDENLETFHAVKINLANGRVNVPGDYSNIARIDFTSIHAFLDLVHDSQDLVREDINSGYIDLAGKSTEDFISEQAQLSKCVQDILTKAERK